MKAKAANGIGPGAGKGVRAEVEARAIRNAKQRERVRDALVNGDWFARMQVAAEVRR